MWRGKCGGNKAGNFAYYDDPSRPTGLWLSEPTHAYDVFAGKGYEQRLVSPKGGASPLEPRALKWPLLNASAKAWLADKSCMALLSATARPEEIDPADYDAVYFTGGHSVMWDFPESEGLQRITRAIWERGGVVSSICHGYCGLLNTKLSNGGVLVAGKRITGFSWREEVLAGVSQSMPYNAEAEMKRRGALRKGASTVCVLCRYRWPSGHWTESRVGQGNGREDSNPPPTGCVRKETAVKSAK